MQVLVTTTS